MKEEEGRGRKKKEEGEEGILDLVSSTTNIEKQVHKTWGCWTMLRMLRTE